jgi:uncharacterized RDD family membrane protein YckC
MAEKAGHLSPSGARPGEGQVMTVLLSWIFFLLCPFLFGCFLPVLAMVLGMPQEWALLLYVAYAFVYFWIWTGPLEEGQKLKIF